MVGDVKKDINTLKPLIDKVDDLTRKYEDMEKRLSVVENNTSKNEILDRVKALLNTKEAEEKQLKKERSTCTENGF